MQPHDSLTHHDKKYKLIVCGGTFDHFHKGHNAFLDFILEKSEKVLLGLTSDLFAKNKEFPNIIESYEARKKSVLEILEKKNAKERIEILPINNIYIPVQWEKLAIEAIIASEESKKGAEAINQDRKNRRIPHLQVEIVPFVKAQDGKNISSQRIRNGEIDRNGNLYLDRRWFDSSLVLPQHLRSYLQKPFGKLIANFSQWIKSSDVPDPKNIVTVGDAITKSFNESALNHKISVVDFHIQRKRRFQTLLELGFSGDEEVMTVDNPAGKITGGLFYAIEKIINIRENYQRFILRINGEEDLSVLPFILLAPLGFVIFYGQPNEGIVRVDVTEERKKKAYDLASKFVFSFK